MFTGAGALAPSPQRSTSSTSCSIRSRSSIRSSCCDVIELGEQPERDELDADDDEQHTEGQQRPLADALRPRTR